jgi:hypothetical protein
MLDFVHRLIVNEALCSAMPAETKESCNLEDSKKIYFKFNV